MLNERVLVTGAGGGVGQSVIKSLCDSNYTAVAYDSSPLAAGLYLTDDSWVGLNAHHPGYIDDVLNAVKKLDCQFIIPGHDVELFPLVKNEGLIQALDVNLVASEMSLISLADDKYETFKLLKSEGFDAPFTWLFKDFEWVDIPVVLKPRRGGARSKGVYIANDKKDFDNYSNLVDPENTVVQEWCPGDEFTCGTLTFEDQYLGSIPMKRELRGGDTYKAFSIRNQTIDSILNDICMILKPKGPCNFQLKFHDNRVRVFEINARFSGTTYLRKLCGFDEVIHLLDLITGQSTTTIQWREMSILRYWTEVVVDNSEIKSRQ